MSVTEIYNQEFEQHFEWAKNRFKDLEKSKQDTIRELAFRLEQSGMPLKNICSEICKNLEGFTTSRYIRECLDTKYKKTEKTKLSLQQKQNLYLNHDKELFPHTFTVGKVGKQQQQEEEKPIVLSTSGNTVEQTSPNKKQEVEDVEKSTIQKLNRIGFNYRDNNNNNNNELDINNLKNQLEQTRKLLTNEKEQSRNYYKLYNEMLQKVEELEIKIKQLTIIQHPPIVGVTILNPKIVAIEMKYQTETYLQLSKSILELMLKKDLTILPILVDVNNETRFPNLKIKAEELMKES